MNARVTVTTTPIALGISCVSGRIIWRMSPVASGMCMERGTTVTTPTRPPHPHPLRHRDRDLLQSNQRSIEIAASGVMANVIMAAAASAKETATQIQVVLEISNASKGKRTSMYLVVAVVVDMERITALGKQTVITNNSKIKARISAENGTAASDARVTATLIGIAKRVYIASKETTSSPSRVAAGQGNQGGIIVPVGREDIRDV